MSDFLFRSRSSKTVLFALALILAVVVGYVVGVQRAGGELPFGFCSYSHYESSVIGIEFDYPTKCGDIKEEVLERGICEEGSLTPEDQCEHRYIGLTLSGEDHWFLSAASRQFSFHPTPREPRYEDTPHLEDIERYCSESSNPLSCVRATNAQGLNMIKVGYSPACNGFEECTNQNFFVTFIETRNANYPVVTVWYDRAEKHPIPDDAINQIINSIRPISN